MYMELDDGTNTRPIERRPIPLARSQRIDSNYIIDGLSKTSLPFFFFFFSKFMLFTKIHLHTRIIYIYLFMKYEKYIISYKINRELFN